MNFWHEFVYHLKKIIKASPNQSTRCMDPVNHLISMSFRIFRLAADDAGLVKELMGVFIRHNTHFDAVCMYRGHMQMTLSGTVPLVVFEKPKRA